ncbi:hypothetical protein OG436_29530 [Streptomyces caniferus]|uniref:hypothetical protein n=1 Tax=Streptomyces caniferus TaxID=285557 RepID=UPI002E27E818|nr:hypothetical protein [Streptomyces caniferus]
MADVDAGEHRGCEVRYRYVDDDGDVMTVQPNGQGEPGVYISVDPSGVVVFPEDVPALVAAIRVAAGLEAE